MQYSSIFFIGNILHFHKNVHHNAWTNQLLGKCLAILTETRGHLKLAAIEWRRLARRSATTYKLTFPLWHDGMVVVRQWCAQLSAVVARTRARAREKQNKSRSRDAMQRPTSYHHRLSGTRRFFHRVRIGGGVGGGGGVQMCNVLK